MVVSVELLQRAVRSTVEAPFPNLVSHESSPVRARDERITRPLLYREETINWDFTTKESAGCKGVEVRLQEFCSALAWLGGRFVVQREQMKIEKQTNDVTIQSGVRCLDTTQRFNYFLSNRDTVVVSLKEKEVGQPWE